MDCVDFGQTESACWSGYLAALIEWGMISPDEHQQLLSILPAVDNCPSVAILLGPDSAEAIRRGRVNDTDLGKPTTEQGS